MEITRTRINGTQITQPKDGPERINAIRQIVKQHQYAKVDGVMVDGFTASGIIQVYDALNEEQKARYRNFHVSEMADIMWKVSKKVA
jgi:hypothetical protein